MMEGKLPQPYLDALEEHQHDVWTHTFQETVDALTVMEEKIRRKYEQQKNVQKLMEKNNLKPVSVGNDTGQNTPTGWET